MASHIDAINITARDHETLGAFWRSVFDLREIADDPNLPGDPVTVYITEPVRIRFLFQPVDDGAQFQPRIHFDVTPSDRTRDAEVERLTALGATVVADRRRDDGSGWVTLRDADGYELCVQRSEQEMSAG
jgi:catechol 2,3-dioxygenase-like lactoylglutathione lyase family enzyme